MTDQEIIETAIQGHASTRDAIRWAIQQVRRPPPLFDKQIDAVTVALWGWDVDFSAGRAYARAIERVINDSANSAHDDAALFSQLLNILGPEAPSCCGCSAEWQAAVQLIRKRLDLCAECGSGDIGNRSQRNAADELEVGWQECDDCGHQWGHG